MTLTDEELLHAFYAGDTAAVETVIQRHNLLLWRIANLILRTRTGSDLQALGESDISARLASVWAHVVMTQQVAVGSWPYQRLTALTWLIHLLCVEMDRHLGFRGPF